MNDSIDKQLQQGLLAPPADFTGRVMAAIALQPDPRPAQAAARVAADPAVRRAALPRAGSRRTPCRISARELLEWLALAGAVLAGSSQLVGLLFGLFIFTSAA